MLARNSSREVEVMLLCILNGVAHWLPFPMVHALVWWAHIGFVIPINFYRYALGRFRDALFLHEEGIAGAEMEFAYELLARRCSPVTGQTFKDDEERPGGISQDALNTRRHRLGTIHPARQDPIESVPMISRNGKSGEGYILKRKLNSIMVLGVDGDDLLFPWLLFVQPPKRRGPAIRMLLLDAREVVVLAGWTKRAPRGANGQVHTPPPVPGARDSILRKTSPTMASMLPQLHQRPERNHRRDWNGAI